MVLQSDRTVLQKPFVLRTVLVARGRVAGDEGLREFRLQPAVVFILRREGEGAGFHLVIRPVEHFADAAADEIGDGDLRGRMDASGERIAPPPAQQAIHFGRGSETASAGVGAEVETQTPLRLERFTGGASILSFSTIRRHEG